MILLRLLTVTICALILISCAEDNPETDTDLPDSGPTEGEPCEDSELDLDLDMSDCEPATTDYMPSENNSADDKWPDCISDDNTYHQIEASVSSISRVEAYDQIGELLWENMYLTPEDFVDARVIYEEEEGIGSRVSSKPCWSSGMKPPVCCRMHSLPALKESFPARGSQRFPGGRHRPRVA